MAISLCYSHLMVKNGNFTWLLTSSGQEWQFHIAIDISLSKMASSDCYWHLVVKTGNFTLLLTSSGQEWQVQIATDISLSRMAIFTWLLTSNNNNNNNNNNNPFIYCLVNLTESFLRCFTWCIIITPAQAKYCVIPLWGGATSSHLNSLGSIQPQGCL